MGRTPNRSEDLARPRSRQGKGKGYEITRGEARPTEIPEPNPEWCHVAQGLWNAACTSGQADFYQDSDWWLLYLTLDQVTHLYDQTRRSPEYLKSIYTALGSLLFTEADRRKAHVELTTGENPDNTFALTVIADYKAALEAS